jgi:hypothetical protein
MGKTGPQREMGYGFGTADLAEADQVESKVLDPAGQAVQVAVVSNWEDQARAAVAGFDRGIAGQPFRQWPAVAGHDELIPVAGLAELGSHGQPSVPARNGAPSSTGTKSC